MNGQKQSVELTRSVMGGYFESEHSDVGVMADDVVFTVMATGDEHRGPEAVQGMLDVRVPLCVVYDLRDGKITAGRVYFEVPALMAQLGAT